MLPILTLYSWIPSTVYSPLGKQTMDADDPFSLDLLTYSNSLNRSVNIGEASIIFSEWANIEDCDFLLANNSVNVDSFAFFPFLLLLLIDSSRPYKGNLLPCDHGPRTVCQQRHHLAR